jgi:dihydroneopterin aldolase
MGFYGPRLEIAARLSRHNSRRDLLHNLLYEDMVERIREVVEDPQYASIEPSLLSTGIDWSTDY